VELNAPEKKTVGNFSFTWIPLDHNYFGGSEGGASFRINDKKPELWITGNLRDREGDIEDVTEFITKFKQLCKDVDGFGYLDVKWDRNTRLVVECYDEHVTWNYSNNTHLDRYWDRVAREEE
jgi:hypothetical protein